MMSNNDQAQFPRLTSRQIFLGTIAVTAIVALTWLLLRWHVALFLLVAAIVISTAIRPAVEWMYRRGLPRNAGIIVVYTLLLALLSTFLIWGAPLMGRQAARIAEAIPAAYRDLRDSMLQTSNLMVWRLGVALPEQMPFLIPPQSSGEESALPVSEVLGMVGLAVSTLFYLIITFIMAFYWTVEGPRIKRAIQLILPPDKRETGRALMAEVEASLGRYIAGQGTLMIIIGTVSLLVYMALGLPYALLLAVVAGIMEAVPIIGPGLGAIPAALVAYSVAPQKAIWVVVATLVVQQLENNFLVPRVMRQSIGVHPLVSLLALISLSALFGIAGALIAIPVGAVAQLIVNRYLLQPDAMVEQEPEGRDRRSVLRYETQEFVRDVRRQARLQRPQSTAAPQATVDSLEAIALQLSDVLASPGRAAENEEGDS